MSDWTFTLAANAGMCVTADGTRLWIDLPVQAKVAPYSRLTPDQVAALWNDPAFRDPDIIVYSHAHPDHYSPALAAEAARRNPQAEVFAPVEVCGHAHVLSAPAGDVPAETFSAALDAHSRASSARTMPAAGSNLRFHVRGLDLHFFPLTHEGADFADVAHFGLILSDGSRRALFVGDGRLCDPALLPVLAEEPMDIAVLPFPWVTLHRGRDFVTEHISPKHLIVNHLPFAEDDSHQWRSAAARLSASLREVTDLRLMLERGQTETV